MPPASSDSSTSPRLGITLGRGLARPQGRHVTLDIARPVASLAEVLRAHSDGEAWWSPHVYAETPQHPADYRDGTGWEGASAVAIDLDYYAPGVGHSAPPAEEAQRSAEALGGLPGTLGHLTPRGVRVVYAFREPVTDRELFRRAALGAAADLEAQLLELDLLGEVVAGDVRRPGLAVDRPALTDLARMLWAPNALVKGEPGPRSAEVVTLNGGRVYDASELAALAPEERRDTHKPREAPGPTANAPPAGGPMARLRATLLVTPQARDYRGRGVALLCPMHPDSDPSGIVYEVTGDLYCSVCARKWGLREWLALPAGRALVGDGLAAEILGLGRPSRPPKLLRDGVLTLSAELLRETPPRRDYLLTDTRTGSGVLVRGRVAMVAARGGVGKTIVLCGLAVAHATGGLWFGPGGWQASQGRVLLLLAEEDAEEVQRRLHYAARAAGLIAEEDFALLAANVTALPLSGWGVALTTAIDPETGDLPETPRAEEVRSILREAVKEGRPYSLVVPDPLARFAGADTEKDNAAATRFVQTVETFTTAECGSPGILLAHHGRKPSGNGKNNDAETADLIRGASALVDGVRWAATIEPLKRFEGAPELLKLRVVKTNYARTPEPLILCRPADGNGCLRVAAPDEVAAYQARAEAGRRSKGQPREERVAALAQEVLKAIRVKPGAGAQLATRLRAKKELVLDACRELAEAGEIVRENGRPHGDWILAESPGSQESSDGELSSPERERSSAPLSGAELSFSVVDSQIAQPAKSPEPSLRRRRRISRRGA